MSDNKESQKDIFEVDGHDLYLIKGTDAFRLYGWSGRHNDAHMSIQMIEGRQDIHFGNRYHKLTVKSYQTLEGDVEFWGQHIDDCGKTEGVVLNRNIDVGHTRRVMTDMAHALYLKAGAKLICRIINQPLAAAKADKHKHELIKPELINKELDEEVG